MSAIRNDGNKPAFPRNKEGGKLNLSINKESLKHLKVRTDLKGGLFAALAGCNSCHQTGGCQTK